MFDVSMVATDPVCKMNVGEADAKFTSVHDGRKFFFCSAACKQQFERNPQRYAK
jgi:YHS domain-containing protein